VLSNLLNDEFVDGHIGYMYQLTYRSHILLVYHTVLSVDAIFDNYFARYFSDTF